MAVNREDAAKWLEENAESINVNRLNGILSSLRRQHSLCTDSDSLEDIQGAIDVIEEAIFERAGDCLEKQDPIQVHDEQSSVWDPTPLVPLDSGVVHKKMSRKEKQAILSELRKSLDVASNLQAR